MEAHSYHSFCVKYYHCTCFTDSGIIKIIKKKNAPLKPFSYDMIILDEAQDITELYFELILKIFHDNQNDPKNIQLCLLGDKYQSIYQFNKADQRYIVYANNIFMLNDKKWQKLELSHSFRITNEMSNFINHCMLKEERISSYKKSGIKPRYLVCNTFQKIENAIFDEIRYYLRMGYQYDEIFILAPSIKTKGTNDSPVRILENKIKQEMSHIPIYIPTSDDEKVDDEIMKNKLLFLTFHQTKGLERKVVIVFNFDESYLLYYNKNKGNNRKCPNELYVACTRASERLTVVHHYQNHFLPFLDRVELRNHVDVILKNRLQVISKQDMIIHSNFTVTDMCQYLPQDIIEKCFEWIDIEWIKQKEKDLHISYKSSQKDTKEMVSEITGVAIPAYFEYKIKKRMSILDEEEDKDMDLELLSPSQLLWIANKWCSKKSGLLFKLYQIQVYDWLTKENLDICMNRLEKLNISIASEFEKKMIVEYKQIKLYGYFDCMDKNNVYEFKCISELKKENYLQLAIYMFMNERKKQEDRNNMEETNYYLYNIFSDEWIQIKSNLQKLEKMMDIIIDYKLNEGNHISDEIFIENANHIVKKYF